MGNILAGVNLGGDSIVFIFWRPTAERASRAGSYRKFEAPSGVTETRGETMKNILDGGSEEGPIARSRRRARELDEESLASAKRGAEQLIRRLGREPFDEERILIEHVAILDARTQSLRKWGKHKEADASTLILSRLLVDLRKMRVRPPQMP
jgi:hypothetical protein